MVNATSIEQMDGPYLYTREEMKEIRPRGLIKKSTYSILAVSALRLPKTSPGIGSEDLGFSVINQRQKASGYTA